MAELFKRRATLQVGTIRFDSFVEKGELRGLDFAFQVAKTLGKEPNTCELSIRNLTESHRAGLAALKRVPVTLSAGYEGNTFLIFRGDLREVSTTRDGADLVTKVSGGDGERAIRHAKVKASFGKNVKVTDTIAALTDAMAADVKNAVGKGNVRELLSFAALEGVTSPTFKGGASFTGSAWENLQKVVASVGAEVSVQDGNLQFTRRAKPLSQTTAAVLAADTGLIGAPDRSAKGIVKAQCLLIPGIYPGARVQFRTANVVGFHRVERVDFSGDTAGTDWYISFEAKEV